MNELNEEELFKALKKYFNFDKFKSDIQRKAIESVLKGEKNVYVSMPTGSGKSLCYLLPGVMQENKITIVISPLIALIKNQLDFLKSRKIRAESLNSTQGNKERDAILGDLKAIKTETKFLYITPEQAATHTFQDLLQTLVRFKKIALFAVDEAHCVSSWGHDFRKDYLKLGDLRKKYPSMQWIALTATAPELVRRDVLSNLSFHEPKIFQVSCFRKNLYYDIVYKNTMQNEFPEVKEYIEKCLEENERDDLKGVEKACGIIYCRKKDTTEFVANALRKQGVSCQAFHSALKKAEKEAVQNDWMSGKVSVIAATVAFGMGIDKASVRFVIHWDVAQNIASYYQESGRAGRDGKKSYCRLYYGRDDTRAISFILTQDMAKIQDKKSSKYLRAQNAMKEFEKIVDHCESVSCRHKLFTKYFGDPPPECKSMCDVCKDKKKCQKNFEMFQQLCCDIQGSTIEQDYDPSDMYEGGRQSSFKKGSFQDYDDEEDSTYDSFSKEKARKEERSFIEKQFALRKMQAAASMEMSAAPKISRVKSASATEVRVSGLTISKRESNLSNLATALKANLEKCAKKNPPEHPTHKLNGEDIEDIAIAIEYRCFESVKAISVYNRNFGKEYYKISRLENLHEDILNHVPKKKAAHGGDYETTINVLKDRYGEDVINELESEMKKKDKGSEKSVVEKKLKKTSSRHENLNQTKISSFFTKKEDNVEVLHSPESDDISLVDVKSEKYSDDEEMTSVEANNEYKQVTNGTPEAIKIESSENEAIKCNELNIKEEAVENVVKDDAMQIENETVDEKYSQPSVESKAPEKRPTKRVIDEELVDSLFEYPEIKSQPPAKKPKEDTDTDLKKRRDKNKGKTSSLVVTFLNKKYYQKKIGGEDPRGLFKVLARRITHTFHDRNPEVVPNVKQVEKYIDKIFEKHEVVTKEEDLDDF